MRFAGGYIETRAAEGDFLFLGQKLGSLLELVEQEGLTKNHWHNVINVVAW